ncbi:MAG TPA: 3-hydroxyacyl-CoA dehydrogenase family protein, partial [Burkholderiaceae bacterium]|nr:3-hydroxyacyl-CoA dehydrogenase family protein [Burkholderiaceae bacterium]
LTVWLSPWHASGHKRAAALMKSLGVSLSAAPTPPDDALVFVTPYGDDVASVVARHRLPPDRTVALDTLFGLEPGRRRVLMCSAATRPEWRDAAQGLMASDGSAVSVIGDSAGFVAQRIVATIVNVACDIAQQGIATPDDIDVAVRLGLGYPQGPLELGDALGSARILEILRAMQAVTGDMRYRPSLWLQRRVQLNMSLTDRAAS